MNSAASRPPFFNNQSTHQSLGQAKPGLASTSPAQSSAQSSARPAVSAANPSEPSPPKRPQLMGPPARPKPPKPAPAPEPTVSQKPPEPEEPKLIGPISKPSERMQYRAIGLLKGKYVASEEQFNRGNILLSDETLIDSVLLGRVTSLIKKHIDLETEHLWVVYPRTLYKEEDEEPALHMQIVGVWEPETLSASRADSSDNASSTDSAAESDTENKAPRYLSTEEATNQCDQFSIRGEIAKYSEETGEITVNIVQKSKSENTKPKRPFKLSIDGKLNGRATGYFWDLKVKREGGKLVLEDATQIGVVPPKKKSKDARRGSDRKRSSGKPRSGSSAPKPMPKKKKAESHTDKAVEADTQSTVVSSTEARSTEAKSTEAKSTEARSTKAKSETATASPGTPAPATAAEANDQTAQTTDATRATDTAKPQEAIAGKTTAKTTAKADAAGTNSKTTDS